MYSSPHIQEVGIIARIKKIIPINNPSKDIKFIMKTFGISKKMAISTAMYSFRIYADYARRDREVKIVITDKDFIPLESYTIYDGFLTVMDRSESHLQKIPCKVLNDGLPEKLDDELERKLQGIKFLKEHSEKLISRISIEDLSDKELRIVVNSMIKTVREELEKRGLNEFIKFINDYISINKIKYFDKNLE